MSSFCDDVIELACTARSFNLSSTNGNELPKQVPAVDTDSRKNTVRRSQSSPKRNPDRPWRKSIEEVERERSKTQEILGTVEGCGVDAGALEYCLQAQELLDSGALSTYPATCAHVQSKVTALLQAATNACDPEIVADARAAAEVSVAQAGMTPALDARMLQRRGSGSSNSSGGSPKVELLHEVIPRLWLGGCVALNNDCNELRKRGVTHVVSVISGETRNLPTNIVGHYNAVVDDREDAAKELAKHFAPITAFVDAALTSGAGVFIHCGAGISRAPSALTAYLVWKLRIHASEALKFVRKARPSVRPNIGFVAELKAWEGRVLAGELDVLPAVETVKVQNNAPPPRHSNGRASVHTIRRSTRSLSPVKVPTRKLTRGKTVEERMKSSEESPASVKRSTSKRAQAT